jgi:hypothetical protein
MKEWKRFDAQVIDPAYWGAPRVEGKEPNRKT